MAAWSKLEPTLAALVDPGVEHTAPAGDDVQVLVKFTGPVEDLTAVGFEAWTVLTHPTDGYSIAAGPIPWRRLDELEAVPHVQFIEASRSGRRELNHSVPEIHADVLHRASPAHLGAGVVVGIIDGAVDFTHPSFRNPDGTTRILGMWDQAAPNTKPLTGPPAFGRTGVEYTQADINATLQLLEHQTPLPNGTKAVDVATWMKGDDGHGSHVAGIAAGNGHPAGNCRGDGVYVGVAPAASLLVVNYKGAAEIGQYPGLVNALAWMWNHPQAAGKGVVVNMSFGDSRGPHDGTSLVEVALDIEALTHPGHVAVKSAGNIGLRLRHATATVPAAQPLDLPLAIDGLSTSKHCHIELWYAKDDQLAVTVLGPAPASGGARPSSSVVEAGSSPTTWVVNPGQIVTITSKQHDPRNSDNVIVVDFSVPSGLPSVAGPWSLHLESRSGGPVAFHAWIDGEHPYDPTFTSFGTRDATITEPGTSKGVITVGAYAQSGFLFWDWSGNLTDFSSYGPTRDGRVKPDIAAPGAQVTSVKAAAGGSCCCDCCHDFYADVSPGGDKFQGTSMAAPHVTGVIALMLEQNPTMSAADVKRQLIATARTPDGVDRATLPDNHWGGGKLDANGAVTMPLPPAAPVPAPSPALAPTPEVAPPEDPSLSPLPVGRMAVARWTDAAMSLPEVQYWAALVSRHFSEVRALINSNMWVATCWHRLDGPALVRALHLIATDPAAAPPAIDAWRPRAGRFLDMLERFGSPALRVAAARERETVLCADPGEVVELLRDIAWAQAA